MYSQETRHPNPTPLHQHQKLKTDPSAPELLWGFEARCLLKANEKIAQRPNTTNHQTIGLVDSSVLEEPLFVEFLKQRWKRPRLVPAIELADRDLFFGGSPSSGDVSPSFPQRVKAGFAEAMGAHY